MCGFSTNAKHRTLPSNRIITRKFCSENINKISGALNNNDNDRERERKRKKNAL